LRPRAVVASIGTPLQQFRRRRRVPASDWRRFGRALLTRTRSATLRAVVDGAFVVLTLKRRGLRPLVRDPSAFPAADLNHARHIADAVDAGLAVLPVAPTCLRRSVTLLRELDRRRLGASLHIGVRSGDHGIEAHAWVQVGDDVINDDPVLVRTYEPLSVGVAEQLLPRFE